MSMAKDIFRPGYSSLIRKFTAGIAENEIYANDWVGFSSTANSGQGPGADGVLEGVTLGTNDFCYIDLLDTADNGCPGNQLGVAMGASVGAVENVADVSGNNVAADNLVIVQCWGVHPMVQTDGGAVVGAATDTVEYLSPGTDAGIADAATVGCGTDDTTGTYANVGVALATDGAYTRDQAVTGGAAFIRCNW